MVLIVAILVLTASYPWLTFKFPPASDPWMIVFLPLGKEGEGVEGGKCLESCGEKMRPRPPWDRNN
jgi:hypothetical protein